MMNRAVYRRAVSLGGILRRGYATKSGEAAFEVHRPFQSELRDYDKSSTKKEQMIFSTLMDSIFEQKAKGGAKNDLSRNVQAFFQNQDGSQIELFKSSKARAELFDEEALRRKDWVDVTDKLTPVLTHLQSKKLDCEIMEYYTTKIINRAHLLSNKQMGENDLVDVENPPILVDSVPLYLRWCLDLLINSYNSPTAAITLFELSKRQSVAFFTASCDTAVYNLMLELRWAKFRDLYAVESLMAEMRVNSIPGNSTTADIISKISNDYIAVKHGVSDNSVSCRWSDEDARRMKNLNNYRIELARESYLR
ncbi:hypothetical protein TRVA0_002S02762 [Trichomonascus vanleenenianus]|uniref:Mtf2p n=1 Tax=Trichomonascus vanleenenianus TaxID=2268995 RepID=UPI003ECAD9D7